MPSNRQLRWESAAHVAMGLGAGLLNLGLLLDRRERDQLPPENDANPVVVLRYPGNGQAPSILAGTRYPQRRGRVVYWAQVRVMDTLDDLREYQIGQAIAWPCVLAAGIAIGWGIWG